MPYTADDLEAWEPVAVAAFVLIKEPVMRWNAQRTMPIFAAVTEYLGQRRREVERYDPDRAMDPLPRINSGAAANILLLRGVGDLRALWDLGQVMTWEETIDEAVETLRCYRAGYTRALVGALAVRELPWVFADAWVKTFPIADLSLLLEAEFTAQEITSVLASGVFPDRSMLGVLRGLLTPS